MKEEKKVTKVLKAFFWLCINCYFFLVYGSTIRLDEKHNELVTEWQGFKCPF